MQQQMANSLGRLRPLQPQISLLGFTRGLAAMSSEVATGINIAKAGSDPPLRPDSELPEWLWPMARPGKSLSELRRAQGELEFEDLQRMGKLENRSQIRIRNASKAK